MSPNMEKSQEFNFGITCTDKVLQIRRTVSGKNYWHVWWNFLVIEEGDPCIDIGDTVIRQIPGMHGILHLESTSKSWTSDAKTQLHEHWIERRRKNTEQLTTTMTILLLLMIITTVMIDILKILLIIIIMIKIIT